MGKLNISNIVEGFTNLVKSKKAKLHDNQIKIEALSSQRSLICQICPARTKYDTCSDCGCYLPSKTRCEECKCPRDKW